MNFQKALCNRWETKNKTKQKTLSLIILVPLLEKAIFIFVSVNFSVIIQPNPTGDEGQSQGGWQAESPS